jgi:hypothetical protein
MWSGRTSQSHTSWPAPMEEAPLLSMAKLMQHQKQQDLYELYNDEITRSIKGAYLYNGCFPSINLITNSFLYSFYCRETRCCYWELVCGLGLMSGHVGIASAGTPIPAAKGDGSRRSLCAGLAFLLADKGKTMAFGAYH